MEESFVVVDVTEDDVDGPAVDDEGDNEFLLAKLLRLLLSLRLLDKQEA
jgi:hypothetical protein